jgi:hypothetical protein
MPKGDLFGMMRDRYAALDSAERKKIIREIVLESAENKRLIQKHFPEFFVEAFGSPKSKPRRPASKPQRKRTKTKKRR